MGFIFAYSYIGKRMNKLSFLKIQSSMCITAVLDRWSLFRVSLGHRNCKQGIEIAVVIGRWSLFSDGCKVLVGNSFLFILFSRSSEN